jgi:hypothetical protein
MTPEWDLIAKAILVMLTIPLVIWSWLAVGFVYTRVQHHWREARNPIIFIVLVLTWMIVLDTLVGLERLRVILGWTMGPGAP